MSLLDLVRARVRDASGLIADPADYEAAVAAALAAWSRHRPRITALDLASAGTRDLALPAEWVEGFSALKRVEYPVGEWPERYLDEEAYGLYQGPAQEGSSGQVLRLAEAPAAGDTVRVWITVPQEETTVPGYLTHAVADLGAAHLLDELANRAAHSQEPLLGADGVARGSASGEFTRRAKEHRRLAYEALGIKEGDVAAAATAVAHQSRRPSWGSGRLTH